MDSYCKTTGKQCFTEREAGERLNFLKKGWSRRGKKKQVPKRKYWCQECGYYHLTHLTCYAFSEHCKGNIYKSAKQKKLKYIKK